MAQKPFHYPLRLDARMQAIMIEDSDGMAVANLTLDPNSPDDVKLAEKIRRLIECERTGFVRLHSLKPKWETREDEPGVWYVYKDGNRENAGPWPNQEKAKDAMGYLAWVAAGGSPD